MVTLIPGVTLNIARESESCTGRKLPFCFTFLCDPDLEQRFLVLIVTCRFVVCVCGGGGG